MQADSNTRPAMNNDSWLARWLPLIKEKAVGEPILEIGCGWGWDTTGHAEIELNYFWVKDQAKRFFDREALLALFLFGSWFWRNPNSVRESVFSNDI